ncbi:MAG: HD domain-containing protein [Angustibacter sp.]
MAGPSSRSRAWAATGAGHRVGDVVTAHAGVEPRVVPGGPRGREYREQLEERFLQPAATRARGAGERARAEEPDAQRTCFERDRDRILHSSAWRRLAGKTQVFVYPADHQRTRLTHALEVAQVATAVARSCGLNVTLTEAIAIGHDCGHGPGGHASEDAFDVFLDDGLLADGSRDGSRRSESRDDGSRRGGFDHAVWGADVTLAPLNLCAQTLDGIRNHSWSRPAPATPEGVVVSWADRIAYTAHDLEDAVHAGLVSPADVPDQVVEVCGRTRAQQLDTFIGALIDTTVRSGVIGMDQDVAGALATLRAFNYERIYTRPESIAQSRAVVRVLQALVEHFVRNPGALPADHRPGVAAPGQPRAGPGAGSSAGADPVRAAVAYVGGMTDRYAFETAVRLLGWSRSDLPAGIDVRG